MEDAGVQRGIWDGDAKTVQQCLTDIFTSVYTTCDIPENAIFGPCVLSHTSLYDSIAFIALKSTDKRTVPYIFRVRTAGAGARVGPGRGAPAAGRLFPRAERGCRRRQSRTAAPTAAWPRAVGRCVLRSGGLTRGFRWTRRRPTARRRG